MKRLIFIVLALLGSLILEDQVQAQLVWNPTIFAPAVNPPGGANNYGEATGQGGFIFTGPTPPANPTEGMLWYDNSTVPQTLKIWDGTTWVVVSGQTADNSGPTPPSNPTDGQLWYDTSTLPATLKVWDGTTWVTVRAGILNSPTFAGSITILNNATVNGPDGSTWTNGGINNLKNLNIATGGALTFHGVPIGGACAANQFMISLSSEIIPTCAAITNISGPVTINNPTFTGTVTMPDGSVWNNTGLSVLNTTVINGPDGSVWNSTGITNVKNISIATGGTITIGGQPVSSGATVSGTAPSNPVAGQLWWDTSVTPNILKIWNGTAWVTAGGGGGVTAGTTPPSPATTGTLWYDTSTTPPTLKVWNGSAWVATNAAIVAPTAPSNVSEGQFWFNTSDLQTYVRFNGQWVAVVNVGVGGGAGGATVGPTAPASPKTGELWYDSVAGALKVWNGSTWASTAPSGAAPSSITDAMLVASYSGVGACSANQYVTALTRNAAPTCAAVTLPAGVTLNNPTLTGTITLPDGSTWTSAGLTIAAGSRAHTLDSLTGASGSTTGALQRASNGTWSVSAVTIASGTTIVSPIINSPSISNPTFSGTVSFPNASIADAALANSYSGVGTCTAGQFVNTLNRNAGPTCASPAAGNFAPFVNPSGGQNNYAPLANGAFTGTMTINGLTVQGGGPWLPVNNPTFTGLMSGPTTLWTKVDYTPALIFGGTTSRPYFNFAIQNNELTLFGGAHWQNSAPYTVADATSAASINLMTTPQPMFSFNAVTGLTVGGGISAGLASYVNFSPMVNPPLGYEGIVSINGWGPNAIPPQPWTAQIHPSATLLQMTSTGNWAVATGLTNRGEGEHASSTYYIGNDANEYAAFQLVNTGFIDGGALVPERAMVLGTNAKNGMVFNSAVGTTFRWWLPLAASQGGWNTNVFGINTAGGVGGDANGTWLNNPVGGPGSYSAYYASSDVPGHYVAMQIVSSNNVYNAPPDSAQVQAFVGGNQFAFGNVAGPILIYDGAPINYSGIRFSSVGYAVGQFTVKSSQLVGLVLPGCCIGSDYTNVSNMGFPALQIGNSYFGGQSWANINISGATYSLPAELGGVWYADGGAGSGSALFQLMGVCANIYNAGPLPAGYAVPWTLIAQWCGSGMSTGHINNVQTARIPSVSSGVLTKGSRDGFGWIKDVTGGETTITFAEEFQGDSTCTLTDSGAPNLWFEANQTSTQNTFVCVVPWTGERCGDGQWVEYHCFGQGDDTQIEHNLAGIRERGDGSYPAGVTSATRAPK